MDSFESDFNVIHKILKNDEAYTKLIIRKRYSSHYCGYKKIYKKKYGNIYFVEMLIDALYNNIYVNEIYIADDIDDYDGFAHGLIRKMIKMRNWKSIYVNTYSASVLDALSSQQNSNLVRLQLSSINSYRHKFLELMQHVPYLEHLELDLTDSSSKDISNISQAINESNIKTFIINDTSGEQIYSKFIDNIIKSKIRNFHLNMNKSCSEFNLINNYTILNFSVNGICPDYAQKIINRNKHYILTILLCMNRKIIPRCVFKSMILNKFI